MSKVQKLRIAPRPVNHDVIYLLEQALADAMAGQVVAVAIVQVDVGREVSTAWARDGHYHALNSGCARLAAQMANEDD